MILLITPAGCIVAGESGSLERTIGFSRKPDEAAEILFSLSQGRVPDALGQLGPLGITACDNDVISDELGCRTLDLQGRQDLFESVRTAALESFGLTENGYRDLTKAVSQKLVEKKLTMAASSKDLALSQATNAIDEIDQTVNLFTERLVEWYGIHFPELEHIKRDNVEYCSTIAEYGLREDIGDKELAEAARDSIGAPMAAEDMAQIRAFAASAASLAMQRQSLLEYVEITAYTVAPNMSSLAGPLIAARLISLAGGLRNLSMKPASTVQMLGAEKALFRHLKTGADPPKHGIIFQHPSVHLAKPWQRGKIARSLAAELAIAARVDYNSGRMVAEELKEKFERRVADIKEKNKYPVRGKKKSKGRRRK